MDFNPIFLSNELPGLNKQVKLMNTTYLFSDIIRVLIDEQPGVSDDEALTDPELKNLKSEEILNSELILNLQNLFNISFQNPAEQNTELSDTIFTSPQKAVEFIDKLINIFEKSGLSLQQILKNNSVISENNSNLEQFKHALLKDLEMNKAVDLDINIGSEKIKITFNKETDNNLNLSKEIDIKTNESVKRGIIQTENKNSEKISDPNLNLSVKSKLENIVKQNDKPQYATHTEKGLEKTAADHFNFSKEIETKNVLPITKETLKIEDKQVENKGVISPENKEPKLSGKIAEKVIENSKVSGLAVKEEIQKHKTKFKFDDVSKIENTTRQDEGIIKEVTNQKAGIKEIKSEEKIDIKMPEEKIVKKNIENSEKVELKNNEQVKISFRKDVIPVENLERKDELFIPEKVTTKDQILFKQAKQIENNEAELLKAKDVVVRTSTEKMHEEKNIVVKDEKSSDIVIKNSSANVEENSTENQEESSAGERKHQESSEVKKTEPVVKGETEKPIFKTELKELTVAQKDALNSEINKVNKPDKVFVSHNVVPEKMIKASALVNELTRIFSMGDKKVITLQLSPENLGKVNITLDVIENNIKANIEVQNESVKQVIQNNSDILKNSLIQSGINLQALNVSLSGNESKHGKPVNQKKKFNDYKNDEAPVNETHAAPVKKMGYNTYEFLA